MVLAKPMPCNRVELVKLVEGLASPEEYAEVYKHLHVCEDCRARVERTIMVLIALVSEDEEEDRES